MIINLEGGELMDPIETFQKETTTMGVYRHLKNQIITGYFRPGTWIRERELKDMLHVSSTPIREALRMLVQEGVLVSIPHKGVRVKDFSEKELLDFYELRSEIEGLAAELAALRRTDEHLMQLENILISASNKFKGQSAIEKNTIDDNNQFHDVIARASNNQSLFNFLSQMRTEVNLLRVMSWKKEKSRPKVTLAQHEQIYEAIRKQDSRLARQHIQDHIWDSAKVVLNLNKELEK